MILYRRSANSDPPAGPQPRVSLKVNVHRLRGPSHPCTMRIRHGGGTVVNAALSYDKTDCTSPTVDQAGTQWDCTATRTRSLQRNPTFTDSQGTPHG